MQESPGVFNEVTFRALDWLLDEAWLHVSANYQHSLLHMTAWLFSPQALGDGPASCKSSGRDRLEATQP